MTSFKIEKLTEIITLEGRCKSKERCYGCPIFKCRKGKLTMKEWARVEYAKKLMRAHI